MRAVIQRVAQASVKVEGTSISQIQHGLLLFLGIERSWLKETYQRYENTMLLVTPKGEIIKEVSILQAFYDAGLEGHIFDALQIARDDPTHHNNLEIVTQILADKIEQVNKGDLLLSIRNMNMLIIVDKESYAIKWTYIMAIV